MTGWLADTFRLLWGALYWNARKTCHVLGGRRGHAPCQVASDSGRAGQTACEAALHYASPGRHRVVCPLLVRRPDGAWICSVDSPQVRPFWARGILLLTAAALLAFAVSTALAFGALRTLGYEISYRQVAWPPAWREFRVVQSRFHLARARAAREEGRPADALLALANAYELNPRDYAAGLLLAQLWQRGQALRSDALFARLYKDHPERREQTAQAWYRALLARGDFASILPLATERLLSAEPSAPPPAAWTQAWLFAARRTDDAQALASLLGSPRLPASLRALLELESSLPPLAAPERARALTTALSATHDPFVAHHLLRRLLEEGRADLVLPVLQAPHSPLGDREKVLLLLDTLAALGRAETRATLFRQLLARPVHPALVELLCTHLVAHPSPELLTALAEKLARDPLPPGEDALPARLAWLVACGATGHAGLAHAATEELATQAGRDRGLLTLALQPLLDGRGGFRLETALPLLHPLPLETTYALYQRYAPSRLPPP